MKCSKFTLLLHWAHFSNEPLPPINSPIKLAPLSNHPSLKYTLLSSAPPQKVSLSKNPLFQIVLH